MSNVDSHQGFTLVEMLAVMTIVALVATLASMLIPGTGRAKLKAVTMETAALLRQERLGAIMSGKTRYVSLDGARRILLGTVGRSVSIPRDVVLDVLGIDQSLSGRQVVARFDPDGTSSGAVLRFSRERAAYELSINWYTGGVALAEKAAR